MLRTSLLALCAFLVPASVSAQVPEGDLADLLPADTMVAFSLDDVTRLLQLDPDGPVRELLDHEAVSRAFDNVYEMLGELDSEEFLLAMDLEEDELARLFTGRVMFAIPEIVLEETESEASSETVKLSFEMGRGGIMMADFGATRERLEELLDNLAALEEEQGESVYRAQVVVTEFEGTDLYALEREDEEGEVSETDWFALVDELLLMSDREETLEDFVDLVRNGAPEGDRLSDAPAYAEALDAVGSRDAFLFVNLGELLPLVNQFIEFQIAKQGMALAMFLRPEDLIESLRLDAIKSLFGGAHVTDDEAGVVFGFTHIDSDLGLHTLLAYGDGGVEVPDYFASDLHSASISMFDISTAYAQFEAMLQKTSPYGHQMWQKQLDQLETEGFPLLPALLDNFDGRFIEVMGYPEAALAGPDDIPTQAYVIRVKDPQSLAELLDGMTEDAGKESVEFMNERIGVLDVPMVGEDGVSYAVVGNNLVAAVGDRKMVESLIASIKDPGESILDDSDLMDAFDALPGDDVVGLGFVDVASLLQNMLRGSDEAIAVRLQATDDPDEIDELIEMAERLEELPDVSDIDYYIVSKTYKSPESYVQRMLLRPNRDD